MNRQLLQTALQARLATLEVVTTGSITLALSGATYTRTSGSFITDGFAPGMEITDWLDQNAVVLEVNALMLVVDETLGSRASASGRTITVGLPSRFATENSRFEPTTGKPWFEEEMVGGPSSQITLGPSGTSRTVERDPLYHIHVHVPENLGMDAHNRYVDGLLELFAPNTAGTLSDSSTWHVRTDSSPYDGPVRRNRPGFVTIRVTVPLRTHLVSAA